MRLTSILIALIISMMFLGVACTDSEPAETETPDPGLAAVQPEPEAELSTIEPEQMSPVQPEGISIRTPDGVVNTTIAPDGSMASEISPTSAVGLPEEWPSNITLLDSMTVVTSSVLQADPVVIYVSTRGTATPDEVESYYRTLEGWSIDDTMPASSEGDNRTFRIARGEELLMFIITKDGTDTKTDITYMSKLAVPQATGSVN